MRTALMKLSVEHRESLILIEAEGLSYEEAAQVCGVTTGTIQRRVHRAWESLPQLLAVQAMEDLAPDRMTQAELQGVSLSHDKAGLKRRGLISSPRSHQAL